ncbi:MAG: hypothetical protein MJ190_00480 [Bacilli bacterium]|nr:hypothetical protein [Bacilli bacterium]
MKNKTLLFVITAFLTAPLLSGCYVKGIEEALERNVYWKDDEGVIDFSIQGPTKTGGYGTYLLEGRLFKGRYSFKPHYSTLFFVPFKYENADFKNIEFTIIPKNKTTLSIYNETASINTKIVINKHKIKEGFLDAKLFYGCAWADEKNHINIEAATSVSSDFNITKNGSFNEEAMTFEFLENKRFLITFDNNDTVMGTYISFNDASMILNVEQGDHISELGNQIKLLTLSKLE